MKRFGRSLKYVYLGLMLLFLYLPILYLILFSFNDFPVVRRSRMYTNIGKWNGFTLANYGDIFTGEDAIRRVQETGVDGLMIARGAMGNPWLFAEIRAKLAGEEWTPPTVQERVAMAIRHYDMLLGWKPQAVAVNEMRKHVCWYVTGLRGASQLRGMINTLTDPEDVKARLYAFAETARPE